MKVGDSGDCTISNRASEILEDRCGGVGVPCAAALEDSVINATIIAQRIMIIPR
jgi:hypothetical protein